MGLYQLLVRDKLARVKQEDRNSGVRGEDEVRAKVEKVGFSVLEPWRSFLWKLMSV